MGEQGATRVLVVEDNEADVRLIREAIRECYATPVELMAVDNGQDALGILGSGEQFDLIILDLNLPKLDGYEFLQTPPATQAPIVVFSSSWNENDSRRAVSLGARAFIRKPSNYVEYVDAVCGFVKKWSKAKTQEG
jgi:two-component system response regulator